VFDELSVEKPGADLPVVCVPPHSLGPSAKMGREGLEVELQAIAGKYRHAIRSQHFYKRVYDRMGHPHSAALRGAGRLSARSNFEHGNYFGASIDSEPNPESVGALASLGAKLIQSDLPELQVLEEPLVE